MQCLKCGKETKKSQCFFCRNDIRYTSITTIWKIPEDQIKMLESLCKRVVNNTIVGYSYDEDLKKLSGIEFDEIEFEHGLYIGQIKNGKRNGFGIQYDIDGTKSYVGGWLDDLKSGYGKVYTCGRCEFEGWFKNDLRCGFGIQYDKNGCVLFARMWEENR